MVKISPEVLQAYPDSKFGILQINNIDQGSPRELIDLLVYEQLSRLREANQQYTRAEATKEAPLCHYVNYFKRFKKTYPVLLQFESTLFKGREVPPLGSAIESLFMAEMKSFLLSAGHDFDKISGNLTIRLSHGTETYTSISGHEITLTQNDMYLADDDGIISSILNGPDFRTRILPETKNVLYFTYCVPGITSENLRHHMFTLKNFVTFTNANALVVSNQTIE